MKYRNILFDADGTLLDFARSEHEALSDTLKHFDLPLGDDIHRGYSEANAEQWALLEKKLVTRAELKINRFRNFCQKFDFVRDAREMAAFYENALSQKSFLISGALETCRLLSQSCNLFIVTNGFRHIQTGRLGKSPLLPYFKAFFISEEIGVEKPDPLYFERVAAQIPSFTKKSALIVGDSLSSDMAGGIGFGIDTCWFNPMGKPTPSNMTLTYTISNLSELPNIILRGE